MSNVIKDTNREGNGISLIEKGKQGVLHAIFSRLGICLLLLVLQFGLLFVVFKKFGEFLPHIYGITILFSIFVVLYVLNTEINPTAKITWLILIMTLPVFGSLLFLYIQADIGHKALKEVVSKTIDSTKEKIPQDEAIFKSFEAKDPGAASLAKYVASSGCYPVYNKSEVTYFPVGEDKFAQMMIELEKAKKFIFMEYFIVNEGYMWGQILEVLARKAKEGVDVRITYDGTCEFALLPRDYKDRLKKLGIKCKVFAPVMPFISTHYNNRDHRKILVIDGETAFTGGINLSDEYINRRKKYGHWKDTAVMVKGPAVKTFTLMFLQMWSLKEEHDESFDQYLNASTASIENANGFVMPYGDSPVDRDKVGRQVYIDILNRATKYVHIMTPYLILDGETESALKFAAERGVDVEIILPGIPDKFVPFSLAYTHYKTLLESGVKIFEYSPGFVHAKSFVADDKEAVVGTINLDYRSLYHHFECAAYMYESDCIPDIERDFNSTKGECLQRNLTNIHDISAKRKITGFLTKALAPLL